MDIIGLIKKHINSRLVSLQTTEIVIVESVDYATWTCSVRPKAKINVRGDVQDMPTILEVPMMMQKAGDSVLLMPIKVADIGLCVFSKNAIDTLLINRDTVELTIPRSFNINDAIYIGSLYTEMDTVPTISEGDMLWYQKSGSYIKFSSADELSIQHKSGAYIKIDAAGNVVLYGRTVSSSEWI